jgi:putative membrane protein
MQTTGKRAFRLGSTALSLLILLSGSYALAQAVPSVPATPDSTTNDSGGTDTQAMKDKIFIRKSTQGGLAEVQLGQLALQKTTSEDIKKFAQRMVDDHTMINESIKPFATSFGVKLPTSLGKPDQAEFDRLNALSGPEFDKEYLTLMAKDHHKDLKDFQEEAASAGDPALKEAVESAHKIIARHARMADRMAAVSGAAMSAK